MRWMSKRRDTEMETRRHPRGLQRFHGAVAADQTRNGLQTESGEQFPPANILGPATELVGGEGRNWI